MQKLGSTIGALRGKFVTAIQNDGEEYGRINVKYTQYNQIAMTGAIAAAVFGTAATFWISTEAGIYYTAGGIIGGLAGRALWPMFVR